MRLSELRPKWVGDFVSPPEYPDARQQWYSYGILRPGAVVRSGMGLGFQCPCCKVQRLVIWFANPIDGGPCYPLVPVPNQPGPEQDLAKAKNSRWIRTGEDYETLTLSPSINASVAGHWHGYITNGNIT